MTLNSMTEDLNDIIGTIHQWRREISDQYGGNLAAMIDDANRRTKLSGRRVLRRGELTNKPMHPSGSSSDSGNGSSNPAAG